MNSLGRLHGELELGKEDTAPGEVRIRNKYQPSFYVPWQHSRTLRSLRGTFLLLLSWKLFYFRNYGTLVARERFSPLRELRGLDKA